MNKAFNNQLDQSVDTVDPLVEKDNMVFVVMDAQGAGKVAIEGRYGIMAFADNIDDLKKEIVHKVKEHFHGEFQGEVYIRQFMDEIITL